MEQVLHLATDKFNQNRKKKITSRQEFADSGRVLSPCFELHTGLDDDDSSGEIQLSLIYLPPMVRNRPDFSSVLRNYVRRNYYMMNADAGHLAFHSQSVKTD